MIFCNALRSLVSFPRSEVVVQPLENVGSSGWAVAGFDSNAQGNWPEFAALAFLLGNLSLKKRVTLSALHCFAQNCRHQPSLKPVIAGPADFGTHPSCVPSAGN